MYLYAFASLHDRSWPLDNGGVAWGVQPCPVAVYSLTAGPQYPPFSICGNQAQLLYRVLTGQKRIHNEVDSSSPNPCCSRVNSIFRVESYRDASVKKRQDFTCSRAMARSPARSAPCSWPRRTRSRASTSSRTGGPASVVLNFNL